MALKHYIDGRERFMELERDLAECSGALERARHPIEWQRKIDEAVAAERERCAKLCEEVEAQAWALWKATADPTEQGRNIGAQHCADAIRA